MEKNSKPEKIPGEVAISWLQLQDREKKCDDKL